MTAIADARNIAELPTTPTTPASPDAAIAGSAAENAVPPSAVRSTSAPTMPASTMPAPTTRHSASSHSAGSPEVAPESRTAATWALEERNRALKLIDSGRATMAMLDTVSDTGMRVNGRPVAEVHLLVDRPGEEPYPVTRRAVVPEDEPATNVAGAGATGIPSQVGRRIPVLVDPGQPDNVLLRWDLRIAS